MLQHISSLVEEKPVVTIPLEQLDTLKHPQVISLFTLTPKQLEAVEKQLVDGKFPENALNGSHLVHAIDDYKVEFRKNQDTTTSMQAMITSLSAGGKITSNDNDVANTIAWWLITNYINVAKVMLVYEERFDYSQSMPYQNNTRCIKQMAKALLMNAQEPEVRNKKLVVNYAYFGFGKTRIGTQFQQLFENIYTNDEQFRNYLESFVPNNIINQLLQAKMIYINCSRLPGENIDFDTMVLSYIVKACNVQPPGNGVDFTRWIQAIEAPLYIVIDEFQMFLDKNAKGKKITVEDYDEVWQTHIIRLQMASNVFLYICGKGILFESIGNSYYRDIIRSPSLVHSVQLQSLSENSIVNILSQLELYQTKPLVETLRKIDGVAEFAKFVHEKTGGIPVLVHEVIMNTGCRRTENMEALKQQVMKVLLECPRQFITPYGGSEISNGLQNVYKFCIWSGILNKCFSKGEYLNLSVLGDIEEFKGFRSIYIVDLSIFCNIYLETVTVNTDLHNLSHFCRSEEKYRFVFPQILIDNYVKVHECPDISFLYQAAKQFPQIIGTGDLLEYFVSLRLHISLSTFTDVQVGEKIPFLCGTPLEQVVASFVPSTTSISLQSFGKVTTRSADITAANEKPPLLEEMNTWPDIINHLKAHPNFLFKFEGQSHSPDSITDLVVNDRHHYLCTQEKNESDHVDFTMLKNDFEKTLPLFKLRDTNTDCVILVVMARAGCDIKAGVYTNQTLKAKKNPKRRKENSNFTIPKNFYLVIPSKKEFEAFVGDMNAKALNNLPKWKKQVIKLSDALELIGAAGVTEPASKKKKK